MSKEVDIVVFVKSNNNESQVPSKKTNVSCSFIYKVSFKMKWERQKDFPLVKLTIPQGEKMFVGKLVEIALRVNFLEKCSQYVLNTRVR